MKQAVFDPVVTANEFDKLCFFDAEALRLELTKRGLNCKGSSDSKLLQKLKLTFMRERGVSKYKTKELPLYDETMKLFLNNFHKHFVSRYGFKPTLESLQVACRHAFGAFAHENYLDSVMSLSKFKLSVYGWGLFTDEFVYTRAGRRTYEHSVSKREVISTVDEFLQEYYIKKGYKQPQNEPSDVDVLRTLLGKLEQGDILSKTDKTELCLGFVEHLKASGVTNLEHLDIGALKAIANSWLE